jgi:hypothetical protein
VVKKRGKEARRRINKNKQKGMHNSIVASEFLFCVHLRIRP